MHGACSAVPIRSFGTIVHEEIQDGFRVFVSIHITDPVRFEKHLKKSRSSMGTQSSSDDWSLRLTGIRHAYGDSADLSDSLPRSRTGCR